MLRQVESTTLEPLTPPPAATLSLSHRSFWGGLLFILIVAAALRLYALGDYPQAFNQDEMVLGYDAWSVWATGKDQHGNDFPVHFRTYNDAVPPVGNYLAAPSVGLLGLSRFSTTLPFALLGVATVGLVALLGRRWWGPGAGLVAACLLALDPWHVNYSRIAYPASSVPFFTVLALYAFTRALTEWRAVRPGLGRPWRAYTWLLASALAFALLMATYTPLKLEAPLLLGATILAAFPWLWRHRLTTLTWLSFFGLWVSPLLYSQLRYWNSIQVHFKHITILEEPNWLPTFVGQYLSHYNPVALLWDGYNGGMAVRQAPVGEVFWLEGLLWVAAAIGLWRNRQTLRNKLGFSLPILLGLWLVIFPISSSLTNADTPHEVRAYNLLPLPQLLAGYGAVIVWQFLAGWGGRRLAWGAVGLAAITLVVFEGLFLGQFFGPSVLESSTPVKDLPYNVGLEPVLQKMTQTAGPCDSLWVEPGNQTYMFYLFDTRYPPAQFQAASLDVTTRNGGWLYVARFNNVHFGIPGHDPDTAPPRPECKGQPSHYFFASHTLPTGPEWKELIAVRNKADEAVWRLLEHE